MASGSGEIVIHAGRLLAEPGQPPTAQQSIRIADGRIVGGGGRLRRSAAGRDADRPEGPLRPARPDRLPRAPDRAARPRPAPALRRGLRSQGRARWRASGAADAGGRLHHRARPGRPQAGDHLRPARGGGRGQGPRPAHPGGRRDPVADRRARPDLRLSPGCLRLRAVQRRRLRRRRRLPAGGAAAGGPGRRRDQVRGHRRGALQHPRRRRPAVHHRRAAHHHRDRAHAGPPGLGARPRHGRHQCGAGERRRLRSSTAASSTTRRSSCSSRRAPSTRRPSSPA